jgi:hypothetical protein
MGFPPLYILCNPVKEPERYNTLVKHLKERGIPDDKLRWVVGPWGSELTSEQYFAAYDPFQTRFGMNKTLCFKAHGLLRGEVSLVLTFSKAIDMALEEGADIAMFFESDVVLREDFMERFEKVLEELKRNSTWDYCSLGEGVGTRPIGREHASYFDETKVYINEELGVFRCTDSMVFRRSFLQKLRQTLLPCRECLDWELNIQALIHDANCFWLDPPLVEPGSGRWRNPSLLPS